jgi:hypothetical protein
MVLVILLGINKLKLEENQIDVIADVEVSPTIVAYLYLIFTY